MDIVMMKQTIDIATLMEVTVVYHAVKQHFVQNVFAMKEENQNMRIVSNFFNPVK